MRGTVASTAIIIFLFTAVPCGASRLLRRAGTRPGVTR